MESLRQRSSHTLAPTHLIILLLPTPGGHTRGSSSVVLDGLSFAVESIVLGSVQTRVLCTRKSSLEGLADSWRAEVRSEALGAAEHSALGEHRVGGVVQLGF